MVIDKIGNINNIIEPKKSKSVSEKKDVNKNDCIQISTEGKKAAELSKDIQVVGQAPDIRADRVNEIKEKIANGSYNFDDPKILELVANRIASYLLR